MRRSILRALCAAAVGLLPCSGAVADPWERACGELSRLVGAARPAQPGRIQVRALAEHLRRGEAAGFSGGAFVVERGRVRLRRGYGFADWAATRPMTPDTVFDIASVSKQFTAAAIVKLEELGRLRVEDSITRFFPAVPEDKRAVTLHQLLTHTAGFDTVEPEGAHTRDAFVEEALRAPLRSPPGERYAYSNTGYTLLAAVVEIASGESYEGFLRRTLWLPAGMHDTGWVLVDRRGASFASGYRATGAVATPRPDTWTETGPPWRRRGAGAILSTMDDLRRWVAALRDGEILSDASIAKLITPHAREDTTEPSYYGYGWAITPAPDGSCTIWHDGSNELHFNVLRIVPERDLVTHVVSLQSRSPLRAVVVGRSDDVLLGAATPLPALRPAGRRLARRLAGRWRADDGTEIRLVASGGRLHAPVRESGVARLFSGFPPPGLEDARRVTRARQRIPAVIDALERGEYEPLLEVLAKSDSPDEERRYWPVQWERWRAAHGAYRGTELVATTRVGERLLSYALVRFERAGVLVVVAHDAEGRISIGNDISIAAQGFPRGEIDVVPPEYVLARAGDGSLRVYNPALPGSVEVRIEAGGGRLRIRSPQGETTLVKVGGSAPEAARIGWGRPAERKSTVPAGASPRLVSSSSCT